MSLIEFYLHPAHEARFREAKLDNFDRLWSLELDDVEPGNIRRGGFSRVSRLSLAGKEYFLKRQENQMRRTWGKPLGRPTYFFEYRFLRALLEKDAQAPVPACALYAERRQAGEWQSILVTRALDGFVDLEQRAEAGEDLLQYMPSVGQALYWFHRQRLQHMAVQPCHLFVNDQPRCCLIDLERSRYRLTGRTAMLRDLRQLRRRAPWLQQAHLEKLLAVYPPEWREQALKDFNSAG